MSAAVVAALGAIGIFLVGMIVLERGLESLAGARLRAAVARFTTSPLSGAVTGAVLTAIVQSSSATTLAAVGLVSAGLLTFRQSLGVIFGANVGTTVTGWIVALVGFEFEIGGLAQPFVLVGALLSLLGGRRAREAGFALAGFGLVFVGIDAMQGSLAGLEGALTPDVLPGDGYGNRVLLVGIGLVVTLVTQSSSAGVATALTALHAGAIHFEQAGALVIGMDVGTTGTALLASVFGSTSVRRTGIAHVVFNLMTGVGAFFLLDGYGFVLREFAPGFLASSPELALVGFHSTFNLLGTVIVLPFTRPFGRLVERIVPQKGSALLRGLEPRFARHPALAVDAAARVLDRVALRTLRETARLVDTGRRARRRGADLDELGAAVEEVLRYLHTIDAGTGRPQDFARETALVHQADHLARLVERLASPPPFSRPLGDELAAHRDAFARALTSALTQGRAHDVAIPAAALGVVRDELEGSDEAIRAETMRRAAQGALSPEDALERLEALRWLRRVAHHAWRIAYHSGAVWGAGVAGDGRDAVEPV
ncbi:MAG: Na/Pi symporter [Planctomycetota bacterium]